MYRASVSNDRPEAVWLNYGTARHEIRPRDKRAIETPAGARAGAHLRGIEPHFKTEIAVETAARTIDQTALAARERWTKECEQAIETQKRRLK